MLINLPTELGLQKGTVLKVLKPLYKIPELGQNWYLTYLEHHMTRLRMVRSSGDRSVLIKKGCSGG